MAEYLTPDHPDAYVDFPLKDGESRDKYHPTWTAVCPMCKGHGGWNLKLRSYPLHDKEDTPENRHKYSHFRASCSQCWGWGFVEPGSADETCIHDYDQKWEAMHDCRWTCKKCGKTFMVDTSG